MVNKPIASGHPSVTEVLDLRFLPDQGLSFDDPLPQGWLDQQLADPASGAEGFRAIADGHARLEVSPLRPVATRPPIRIFGEVEAKLGTACVRCLQPIEQHLVAPIDLTIFASSDPDLAALDGEEGLSAAQLDEGTYEHNQVDLPSLVREALLLEMAMNPQCADEAACSNRTDALLKEANRAAEHALPDRWAALRRIAAAGGTTPGSEENED